MGKAPEEDLVTVIAAGVGWLTTGTNLFAGPVRPVDKTHIPGRAVFVFPSGGIRPEAFLGETEAMRRSGIMIRTRGNHSSTANAYKTALSDARAVRDVVHYASLSGYFDVRAEQSEPIYIGEDDAGHPEFSINLTVQFKE